jgi:1-acyl-sn-glycerol-3-phosphate acyltransferase
MGLAANLWYDVCYWACKISFTCAFSMRCEGWANVPAAGPVLLLANHQSFLDPPAVGTSLHRRIHYLARKTLFRNRLFGNLLLGLKAVPVDQEGVATEGLKTVLKLLKAGEGVLVFPEGERTPTGKMLPLKPGVALLIRQVDMPVVPVGIAGAYDTFPRSGRFPVFSPLFLPARRKGTLAVSVGKPLDSRRLRELPRDQMLEAMHQEISKAWQRAEKIRRKG